MSFCLEQILVCLEQCTSTVTLKTRQLLQVHLKYGFLVHNSKLMNLLWGAVFVPLSIQRS